MEYPSTKELKEIFNYSNGYLHWNIKPSFKTNVGSIAGAKNVTGYWQISYKSKKYKAHRLIWLWHGFDLTDEIDHIDGNKLNNNIENIRAVNKNQNQWNAKIRSDNKSGVKGVLWHNRDKKWVVSIRLFGKAKHFGYHNELEFAELVAKEARKNYQGINARNQ